MTTDFKANTTIRRAVTARALALLASVALLLVACGQPASITLTLDTASVELIRGSQVDIEVTLVRSGSASADVVLSATGLPANVTASFAPGRLVAGATASTLTLAAGAGASDGQVTVTVSGAANGLVATADLELEVTSLSVTGTMLDLLGTPVTGVAVSSQGDVDITDADGEFTLTGLSLPYEIASYALLPSPWYHVFENLTETDPVLFPIGGVTPTGTPRTAPLSGQFVGANIPVAANQLVLVCIEGLDAVAFACTQANPGASSYNLSVQWLTSTTRDVRVHAIQLQHDAGGHPVAYLGYGTAEMTLTNGVANVGDIALGDPLTSTPLQFDVDAGTGTLQTVMVSMALSPEFTISVITDSSGDASYDVLVPVIPGAVVGVTAQAGPDLRFATVMGAATAGATVQVPDPVSQLTPADATVGVTIATDFSVADAVGGELTYLWQGAVLYALTTNRTSVTIPDGSAVGMALPAAQAMSWQVMEAAVDPSAEVGHGLGMYAGLFVSMILGSTADTLSDGSMTLSPSLAFTTAP